MRMISTRGLAPPVNASQALTAGLAPDGGLYLPAELPRANLDDLAGLPRLASVASRLLAPFFEGDPLAGRLPSICRAAFATDPVLRAFGDDQVLELFHGPTAAFKDYGARFLAECLAATRVPDAAPLTILVATSGDTGAAVAAAFHQRPGFRVAILYPQGRVAPRQAHQLGCFGDNVRAFAVAGDFDDCQRLAKAALNDTALRADVPLSSANSISLGRLLPQMAYYAWASLRHRQATGRNLGFVVPTGNLGNALAAVLARHMGLPIGRLVLATNANQALPEFFAGAEFRPRPVIPTLANAMDVGAPSNFERLDWLFSDEQELRHALHAQSVSDPAIQATIRQVHAQWGETVCPHTATAVAVLAQLRQDGETADLCVVATAHPAKFPEVVEPLLGSPVPVPAALAAMLARPSRCQPLAVDEAALGQVLRRG